MRKPLVRRALGEAPPERPTARPPRVEPKRPVPRNAPPSPAPPTQRPISVPAPRGVARTPQPRTPTLVRTGTGALNDLFALFPDLPRPSRTKRRLR